MDIYLTAVTNVEGLSSLSLQNASVDNELDSDCSISVFHS